MQNSNFFNKQDLSSRTGYPSSVQPVLSQESLLQRQQTPYDPLTLVVTAQHHK